MHINIIFIASILLLPIVKWLKFMGKKVCETKKKEKQNTPVYDSINAKQL